MSRERGAELKPIHQSLPARGWWGAMCTPHPLLITLRFFLVGRTEKLQRMCYFVNGAARSPNWARSPWHLPKERVSSTSEIVRTQTFFFSMSGWRVSGSSIPLFTMRVIWNVSPTLTPAGEPAFRYVIPSFTPATLACFFGGPRLAVEGMALVILGARY